MAFYKEVFTRPSQINEIFYTWESIAGITCLPEHQIKSVINPRCNVNGEPIIHPIRARKTRMSYRTFYSQEDLETFIKLSLLKKEGMGLHDAIDLLREKSLTIAEILGRSKGVRRVILTKSDFYPDLTRRRR